MNLEEIRAKLREAQGGKAKRVIWKPKAKHIVRLLPLPGEADITETILWHYGVDNGRKIFCPQTDGEDCAFCDLAQSLRSFRDVNGNEKSEAEKKSDWKAFQKIQAGTKYYAPIIVRKEGKDQTDEYEGPFWWEMSPKVREKLLTICANEDWNDAHEDGGGSRILTSPTQGLDLVVKLLKAGEAGNTTSFDATEVDERKKFTPLFKHKGEKAVTDLLESLPSLREGIKVATSVDVEKVFSTWEASLSSEESTGDGKDNLEHGSNNAEPALDGKKDVNEILAKIDLMLPKKPAVEG